MLTPQKPFPHNMNNFLPCNTLVHGHKQPERKLVYDSHCLPNDSIINGNQILWKSHNGSMATVDSVKKQAVKSVMELQNLHQAQEKKTMLIW